MISELVLRPIESAVDHCMWEAADGTQYDVPGLAAKSSELLAAQMRTAE